MKSIRALLQEADPLEDEPTHPLGDRGLRRQAVLEAASAAQAPAPARSRSRLATFVTVCLALVAVLLLGSRAGSLFVSDLQAAVRFEVRLAEDKPSPVLMEAKASGAEMPVYIHQQVVVSNGDIASARIITGRAPERYSVGVELNASGAEKMRRATTGHVGRPMAVLIDGEVVMAPILRTPISGSAVITGNFTKAEAERIANGIGLR